MSAVDSDVLVFLVDDDVGVTDGLSWLLESVKIPSRAFASPQAFLAAARQHPGAACAVVDLRMPEMSGLELQQRLSEAGCDMPLIFLTAHGDVSAAVHAMQAGAVDFVQKPFNPERFLASVRKSMRLSSTRFAQRQQSLSLQRRLASLSPREAEVLQAMLVGQTSKEIARGLGISPKTVDVHRANIVRKMGAESSTQIVRELAGSLMTALPHQAPTDC
ncbi:response regulator transcription factor [Hydrogenophaga defluvii]|uniref:Response regulator transcription factor n=1 Tax=Hydrogenophaga defluvii TaxID=249410 RepID=A0ABW2S9I5_9BURK